MSLATFVHAFFAPIAVGHVGGLQFAYVGVSAGGFASGPPPAKFPQNVSRARQRLSGWLKSSPVPPPSAWSRTKLPR